jgi:3-oxoacyl-[acyl-carrier protein] reductase
VKEVMKSGDHAVITGAASGIGRAMAMQLASEGIHLGLIDIDADRLYEVADEARLLDVEVAHRVVDCSDADAVTTNVRELANNLGGIELCAPMAGLFVPGSWVNDSPVSMEISLLVNLLHPIAAASAALAWAMENDAACHVLIAGSDSTLHPRRDMGPYVVSKAALAAFALDLHTQLKFDDRRGVTLGLVFPTQSDLGRSTAEFLGAHQERLAELDRYLSANGDPTDVVVSQLLAAVRSGVPVVNTEQTPTWKRRVGYAVTRPLLRLLPLNVAALAVAPTRRTDGPAVEPQSVDDRPRPMRSQQPGQPLVAPPSTSRRRNATGEAQSVSPI